MTGVAAGTADSYGCRVPTLIRLISVATTVLASLAGAQAPVQRQGQSPAEAAWRAQRAADSVCATYPRVGSRTTPGLLVRRDPATGSECRKSRQAALNAYVLTDHLICPSATPWNDTNPLTLLTNERIARIEFKRDSLTFAKWRCPSPVDAVVIVTAKPAGGS